MVVGHTVKTLVFLTITMYGCHPASTGVCDCDWDTDDRGRDFFVQCDDCALLWKQFPDAITGFQESSLDDDLNKIAGILHEGDVRGAVVRVLELGLLHRSSALRSLFSLWLPVLLSDADVIALMGDALGGVRDTLGLPLGRKGG